MFDNHHLEPRPWIEPHKLPQSVLASATPGGRSGRERVFQFGRHPVHSDIGDLEGEVPPVPHSHTCMA